jgi:pimeloyl-ACP methyl ester carboxylesterase
MRSTLARGLMVGATAMVALAAACGGDSAKEPEPPPTLAPSPTPGVQTNASFEYTTCPFDMPDGQVEGKTVSCGNLIVPEDRSDPASAEIKLAVAIFSATGPDEQPDPFIYLHGGPGGPALGYDSTILTKEDIAPIQEKRDVVIFDQRGVGASSPSLLCKELTRLQWGIFDPDADDPYLAALQQCHDRLVSSGVKLPAYNSAASAADIADLAAVLHYDTYNLYGVSYGTRLALTAMRDAPQHIRSVILDSTLPLQENLYSDEAVNFSETLEQLFTACAGDAACNAYAPDLRGTFTRLVNNLNARPMNVDVDDGSGEFYTVPIDGITFTSIVYGAFYVTDLLRRIPELVVRTADGDAAPLGYLASLTGAYGNTLSTGAYLSIMCQEEVPWNSEDTVRPAAGGSFGFLTDFAKETVRSYQDRCSTWNVPAAPPLENEPVTSGVPALVMAGQFDPITPPSYGRLAAQSLSQAHFVEFPALGHATLYPGCPTQIVAAFLDAPQQAPDTSCVATMPGLDFSTP